MNKTLASIAVVFSISLVGTEVSAVERTVIVPPGSDRAYDEWHYAPATRVGDVVYVSGIPAGPGVTYEECIENLFKRLDKTLAEAGATLDDVVDIVSFHAEAKDTATFTAEFEKFSKIRDKYFRNHYPSWTVVGTTALLAPGAPVELRAVAVVGSGKNVHVKRAKAAVPKPE